jgi:hypothetical protein
VIERLAEEAEREQDQLPPERGAPRAGGFCGSVARGVMRGGGSLMVCGSASDGQWTKALHHLPAREMENNRHSFGRRTAESPRAAVGPTPRFR